MVQDMEPISNNVITLAETLNSLALPAAEERSPGAPVAHRKRWPAYSLAALLVGLSAGAFVFRDQLAEAFPSWAAKLPWSTAATAEVHSEGSASQAAEVPEPSAQPVLAPPVAAEITGSGYVVAPTTSTLYAQHTDRIIAVHVQVGETVRKGQSLVDLEGTNERFALERARMAQAALLLDVQARRIDLDQAQAEQDRAQQLADKGAVAKTNADDARVALDKARVDLDRAEQLLAQNGLDMRVAQDAVDRLTVRAPSAGTVSDLSARVGNTVFELGASDVGDSQLLTIIDTGDLVIDADFAERNLSTLQHPVTAEAVLDAFPDQPFEIELERIATIASSQKGTIAVRFRIVNPPDGTRPNMAVRIRVIEAEPAKNSRSN
jgi:RND family efflux transporter MFP subunit